MKSLILAVLLVGCVCSKTPLQNAECGAPCGPCQDGRYDCDSETCQGGRATSPEVCDGVDNDCNGLVDDFNPPCQTACGAGHKNGCAGDCDAPQPQPEVCNGKDDDCDGIVDNNLATEFCYTGPTNTVGKGVCAPGFNVCIGGKRVCSNEVLPSTEICDGRDNDCDGEVDNGTYGYAKLDIVFVMDNSGSMISYVDNLRLMTQTWLTKDFTPDLRVGLVSAPPINNGMYPSVELDLTDNVQAFNKAFAQQDGFTGSGSEPTLDAIVLLSQGALPMSWRDDAAHIIIVYSDEDPQQYYSQQMSWPGWTVHVFTSLTSRPQWARLPVTKVWDLESMNDDNLASIMHATVCN